MCWTTGVIKHRGHSETDILKNRGHSETDVLKNRGHSETDVLKNRGHLCCMSALTFIGSPPPPSGHSIRLQLETTNFIPNTDRYVRPNNIALWLEMIPTQFGVFWWGPVFSANLGQPNISFLSLCFLVSYLWGDCENSCQSLIHCYSPLHNNRSFSASYFTLCLFTKDQYIHNTGFFGNLHVISGLISGSWRKQTVEYLNQLFQPAKKVTA
jgi:hypothetical protein